MKVPVGTWLVLTIIFSSCEQGDETSIINYFSYAPLEVGMYHLYEVEEIKYILGTPDTITYLLKISVADSFPGISGEITYVLHLRGQPIGSQDVIRDETWSVTKTERELIRQEQNTPYVAMKNPVVLGYSWNGNRYNNQPNPNTGNSVDMYTYTSVGEPATVSNIEYGNTLTITQEDNEEFIVYYDKRIETYAEGIGLIYKETNQLSFCTAEDCLGEQIVEEGVIYKQSLVTYGKE